MPRTLYIYTLWSDVDYPKLILEKLGFPITVVGEASDNPLVGLLGGFRKHPQKNRKNAL